jgi:hypothetical protein
MLPNKNKQPAMAAGVDSNVKTVRNGAGGKQRGPRFPVGESGEVPVIFFFRRSIPVGIPSAAFQLEAAGGEYLLGFSMAFWALDRFSIHSHQFFGNMTTFALEFVNRHRSILSESGCLCKDPGCMQWPFLGQLSSVSGSCQALIISAFQPSWPGKQAGPECRSEPAVIVIR